MSIWLLPSHDKSQLVGSAELYLEKLLLLLIDREENSFAVLTMNMIM